MVDYLLPLPLFSMTIMCVCVYLLISMKDSVCVLNLIQGDDSNTVLIEACRKGRVETATVLLEHGAYVNYQNEVNENLLSSTSILTTDHAY